MRKISVFFYGLFMDHDFLKSRGIDNPNLITASVPGFRLVIGNRATLVPDKSGLVYGLIGTLTHDEINSLYADSSVRDYQPEAVSANLQDGESIPALCFNLVVPPEPDERNPEYGRKLHDLAERLGFPEEYVSSIK